MIILTKNILERKKQMFNDKYDDDSFSIHNLTKPNTPTTIQPPKMMEKCIPREFIDIATNTDYYNARQQQTTRTTAKETTRRGGQRRRRKKIQTDKNDRNNATQRATVADLILNLSHSATATTVNIAGLVNQITAGNAQGSSSSSNEVISVHSSPPITVNSSSSESPTEIPAPTEDEEEEEKDNFEKLKI